MSNIDKSELCPGFPCEKVFAGVDDSKELVTLSFGARQSN